MKKILYILLIATLLIPISSASIFDLFVQPTTLLSNESRWSSLSLSLNNANTQSNITKLQHILTEYNYTSEDVFAIHVSDLDKTFLLSYTGLGITTAVEVTQELYLTESQIKEIINILSTDTSPTSISIWTKIKLWYVLR